MKLPMILKAGQKGHALVALLAFMSIALTLSVGATTIAILHMQGSTTYASGEMALSIAESGAENALLRLLRDPDYNGEVLPIGEGAATISVSGSSPIIITSEGQFDNFSRTIEVSATRDEAGLTVSTWRELP